MISDFIYATDSLNILIFRAINNMQEPFFQQYMHVGSAIGKYTLFPVYLAMIAVLAWHNGKSIKTGQPAQYGVYIKNIKHLILSLIIAYVIYIVWVAGLKHLVSMPRPFVILPDVHVLDSIKNAEDPFASLPSGHAAFAMMMLVSLWPILNKIGKVAGIFLVLWIGISRIALGVHLPFDIVASWVMSFIITTLTLRITRYFMKDSSSGETGHN